MSNDAIDSSARIVEPVSVMMAAEEGKDRDRFGSGRKTRLARRLSLVDEDQRGLDSDG